MVMTNDKSDRKDRERDTRLDGYTSEVGTLSEAEADEAARQRNEQLQREAEEAAEQPVTHYNAHLDGDNVDAGTLNAPADVHERAAKRREERERDDARRHTGATAAHTREAKPAEQGGTATRS
jgi:hypothetical protein